MQNQAAQEFEFECLKSNNKTQSKLNLNPSNQMILPTQINHD